MLGRKKHCALSIKDKAELLKKTKRKLESNLQVKSLCESYHINSFIVYNIKKQTKKLSYFFLDCCSKEQMGIKKNHETKI